LYVDLGQLLTFYVTMRCYKFDQPTNTAQRIYFDVLNVFSQGFSATPTAEITLTMGQQAFSFPPLPTGFGTPPVGAPDNLLAVGVPFLPLRVSGTLRWRVNSGFPYSATPIDFSIVSCSPIADF
jgi:hypothetical protein